MTLREALEMRDGDMMVIDGKAIMYDDCIFTEKELSSEVTPEDDSFFTGLSRVKFTEVKAVIEGKEILFDITK